MAKIVHINRSKRGGYRLPEDVMTDIRWRMHEYTPADLADAVGVSVSCMYAIRSGRTKWPRGTTLFPLLEVLDLELVLIDQRTGQRLGRNG